MKTFTRIYFLIIVLAFAAFSCQNEEGILSELSSADTKYYEMEFTVQVTDLNGFQIFQEESFSSSLDKILSETGISEKRLNAIYLKEADFRMESNSRYEDLSVMRFLELTIYTNAIGEKKVARLNPVPTELSSVTLNPINANILPYFEEEKFIMTAQGFLEERIYEDINIQARFKFEVKAGI